MSETCKYIQIQVRGDADAVDDALRAIRKFVRSNVHVRAVLDGTHSENVEISAAPTRQAGTQ